MEIVHAKVHTDSPLQPSALLRFKYMFEYFMTYFIKEKGFYVYRLLALIIVGVFVGTLFLNLSPTTQNINSYVGALFFAVIAMMMTAVSACALFAKDRYEAVDRVKNGQRRYISVLHSCNYAIGIYTPAVFVAAQFLASCIYNFVLSVVFISLFHWLTNLNPNREAYVYDIFINWGHLLLMDSFLVLVIEVLKNDFLSTTAALVFIGSCMSLCGFFRSVADMPVWISWMSYIMPLKYSFDGFVWEVFSSQTWTVNGTTETISGVDLLDQVFSLRNVNPWGMFGALMAYVIVFRGAQYFLFAYQTGMLLSSNATTEAAPRVDADIRKVGEATSNAQPLDV